MKQFLASHITCPHCGANTDIDIDASNGDQEFYESCSQCCKDIHIRLHLNEVTDTLEVFIDADDEQVF